MRQAVARLTWRHNFDGRMSADMTTDTFPLSPLQQGMLFHSLSSAHVSGVDVEQIFCTLHEDLNVASFQSAWRRVVARHSVLRTSFHWRESTGPQQRVHPQVE